MLDVYEDRVVVKARDFGPLGGGETNEVHEVIRTITIPNPLVD